MTESLDYIARVSWSTQHIMLALQIKGQPTQLHERLWVDVEAWAAGRPEADASEGVWLLVRGQPYCDLIPTLASGAVALTGELRARGCRELDAAALVTEAERRAQELPLL